MKKELIIDEAIKSSEIYAKKGEKIAKESIKLVKKASTDILEKLNVTIKNLNERNINSANGIDGLIYQLNKIKDELSVLPDKMIDNIKCISKNTINITLFGRTMAGKSTLMEILTHGKGDSIGKGYQRTTRDVREYSYKGLTITDVPGSGAFEGKEDEEIAYNSAQKSDLIFFLITDDAPQASEAECLRKILNLGKPVVCLVNVKANIDNKTSLKMFSRDIGKKMFKERLQAIKNQFLSFGATFGQSWDMLTFEFVHLKSAYLSQTSEWIDNREELYRLSRFENVEKLIAEEITNNGGYYKIKAYIDTVVVPLMTTADLLIQQSAENLNQSKIIDDKKNKLNAWLVQFEARGKDKIAKSINNIKNEIKKEIPSFSEKHYDDKNAGDNWVKVIKKYNIEDRCGEILDQLAKECENKLIEIYREIAAELKFSSSLFSESKIQMNSIVDSKRIWNWGVGITTFVLDVLCLFGVPIVGWVALGVGIIGGLLSCIFKSKEKKIKEAREKLEKNLKDNLDKQFDKINKQMSKIFNNDLLKKQVNPSFELFREISKTLGTVSESQKTFARNLYDKQDEINKLMINEATIYLKDDSLAKDIVHVARIPGTCVSLYVNGNVTKNKQDQLERLLKETLTVARNINTNNVNAVKDLLSKQIGITKNKIEIELDDGNPVSIKIICNDKIDPIIINKIKMAQQILHLYISR